MTEFEENKPGYFTVKIFEEIEDFDKDQYGNVWYNVLFEGDAETFMWLKKDPPVEGQKYYGHYEKTKSGKRLRFKTDKVPEGATNQGPAPAKADNAYLKDVSDLPRSIILELLKYYDVQSLYNSPKYTNLINLAQSINDDMLTMIKANRSGETSGAHPQESLKEPQAAAAPLRSAWEDRKNLPKAVHWAEDEPPYSDQDIPEEV